MFNRLIVSLIITAMFVIPLIPAETEAEFDEDILDLTPHWRDFSRDTDGNGIDDLIDESTDSLHSIIIVYDERPTDTDVSNVESLDLDVWYRAVAVDALLVRDVTKDQINIIRFIRGVNMVEINPTMEPLLDDAVKGVKARPTNLAEDGVKYNDVWEEMGFDGTGVNIAIMDTGVNDPDHESLDDRDDDLFTIDPKFIGGWDTGIGGSGVNPHDKGPTGHGTHVAGIALGTGGSPGGLYSGVAPGARLVDVKTLTDAGVGGFIIPAIDWCIANKDTDWENNGEENDGIQIMSMSLGGSDSNGDDQISLACNDAVDAGIVVVAAMGNNGARRVDTPAAATQVIAVASSDDKNTVDRDDDTISTFSNYGPRGDGEKKPDVTAPGTQIMAPTRESWAAYNNFDGTSMATPIVSGVIALMLQANPDLTPAQVKSIIHETAEEKGSHHIDPSVPKYDTHWGWGLIDAYEAVSLSLGRPDLTVVSVDMDPTQVTEDDGMRLLAEIRERNDRDVEADVEFYDETDGEVISTIHVDVPALATETVSSGFFTAKGGDRTFRITIKNAIPEEETEINNQMVYSEHVNYRPEPKIIADETTAKTNEDIAFDGVESTDKDGTVEWYFFDFGDGTDTGWQEEDSAVHQWKDDGDYEVSLKVKDNMDAESSDEDKVLVTIENRNPTAGAGSDRTATEGEEVEFSGTGEDEDGTIDLYEWDFDGDGTYDWNSEDNGDTTHTYDEEGNYTAMLRVTDDDGATATDDREIEVIDEGTPNTPPEAKITSPEDAEIFQQGDEIEFDGRLSFDPDTDELLFSWTDNGREFGTEDIFTEILDPGDHRMILQVDDQRGGVDSEEVNIKVNSPPTAIIDSPEDEETYYTNEDITFDARNSDDPNEDALSYTWRLNGDHFSNQVKFDAELDEDEYEVSLTVDDGNGATDEMSVTIHVEKPVNKDPIAVIDSPEDGSEYRDIDEILFDASNSSVPDGDTIVSYEWYKNSVKMSEQMKFSEKIEDLGEHTIKLIVWDDKDGRGEKVVTIKIVENRYPVARITDPKDGEVYTDGVAIDFDGRHSNDDDGDELTFEWYDNDDLIATAAQFSEVLGPGTHTIRLAVNDGELSDEEEVSFRVNKRPNADISYPEDGAIYFSDEVVNFDARSSSDPDGDIISYIWYDNGEKMGSGQTLERVMDTGNHEVTLTVKDNDGATSSSTIDLKAVDHSLAFNVQEEYVEAEKGKDAIFHIKVHNLAEKQDTIRLSAEEAVDFSKDSFTLDPNAEQIISMAVTANNPTRISLTAWAGQYAFYTTADLRIAQEYGVSMESSKNALTGEPGTSLNYILVVTNDGNGQDTITITHEATKTWQVEIAPTTIELHPDNSGQIIVKVKIPDTATVGESMVLRVFAGSKDGETSTYSELTTTATAPPDGPDGPKKNNDDSPGFEVAIMVAALMGAMALAHFRKRH